MFGTVWKTGAEVQTLEVIVDDAGTVQTFRVTKRDPWKN